MKIEASKDDLKRISHLQANSVLERWNRWKDSLNFNVGDILIKEINRRYVGEPSWEVETASQKSSYPAKYIYLHKDSHGMGYIKKLSADGEHTIGFPMSLFDMDLDRVRFKVDVEFQDAVLLEGEENYDPAKRHKEEKKLREEIRAYNMKQILKVKDGDEMAAYLAANIGSQIWVGVDRTGDSFEEYTIGKIAEKQNYEGNTYKIVSLIKKDKEHKHERVDYLWSQYIVFKTRPRSVKDQV